MLWLYRIFFLPALVVLLPRYLRRMLRRGGYRRHFSQRLGATVRLPAKRPGVRRIWLQAVSEGERWPEHIHQAGQRGVPVLCINARLSDRSFRRMRALGPAARPVLAGITRLLPGSELDAARFRQLGFPAARLTTTGNLKLDVTIPLLDAAERAQLRKELGLADHLLVLGSSTWPGEEAALVAALKEIREAGIPASLLIVPRHAERRMEIQNLLSKSGLTFHFRSRGPVPGRVDVAVGDTTGELRRLTQLADVVFVGKSLPPHTEGQTPIESAALEKPILFGPGMGNFRQIAAELVTLGAAQIVRDPGELAVQATALLGDESRRAAMAGAARKWHLANQGALERTLAVIREELGKRA